MAEQSTPPASTHGLPADLAAQIEYLGAEAIAAERQTVALREALGYVRDIRDYLAGRYTMGREAIARNGRDAIHLLGNLERKPGLTEQTRASVRLAAQAIAAELARNGLADHPAPKYRAGQAVRFRIGNLPGIISGTLYESEEESTYWDEERGDWVYHARGQHGGEAIQGIAFEREIVED